MRSREKEEMPEAEASTSLVPSSSAFSRPQAFATPVPGGAAAPTEQDMTEGMIKDTDKEDRAVAAAAGIDGATEPPKVKR